MPNGRCCTTRPPHTTAPPGTTAPPAAASGGAEEAADEISFADVALDLDLPAPKGTARSGGGAPTAPVTERPTADLRGGAASFDPGTGADLPAPKSRRPPPAPGGGPIAPPVPSINERQTGVLADADLPRRKGGEGGSKKANERPTVVSKADDPAPALADAFRTPFDDLDLPAPKDQAPGLLRTDEAFGDMALPTPKGTGGDSDFGKLDLPTPRRPSSINADDFGGLDLPATKDGGGDLPRAKGDLGTLDLPAPALGVDLPRAKSAGLDTLDLPSPAGAADLPARLDTLDLPAVGEGTDLPMPRDGSVLPGPKGTERDFPAMSEAPEELDPDHLEEFDELALPEPRALVPEGEEGEAEDPDLKDAAGRTGLGSTAFGEIDLGGEQAGAEPIDDDMEFAIPEAGADPDVASVAPQERAVEARPRRTVKKKKQSFTLFYASAAALLVVVGVGVGLGFTSFGFFGMYLADGFLPGAGDPATVRAAIREAEDVAESDTYEDTRAALRILDRARTDAGLNRELLGRSLLHHSLFQVRFGADRQAVARTAAVRARIRERGSAERPEVALGLAADELRRGLSLSAAAKIREARAHAPSDPYVDLVAGELALSQGNYEAAGEDFARAVEQGAGARGLWGQARVRVAQGDPEAIREAVDAVLAASPRHGDALAAKAELVLREGGHGQALQLARQVVGQLPVEGEPLRAPALARARGWTVIGRVRESAGLTAQALHAYEAATEADSSFVPALVGAGRVLLAERPIDALARFESVIQSDGSEDVILSGGRSAADEARLGRARALLAQGRAAEARRTLTELARRRTEDPEVLRWLGKAEERMQPPNLDAAEQHYRAAIRVAPEDFPAYLAMAELFLGQGRTDDAGEVLDQAALHVPATSRTSLQRGQFEIRRGDHEAAIRELRMALELEPDLPPALFSLGVAYRSAGHLNDAEITFNRLAALDPSHPGLEMERGRLAEARGRSDEAVEAYEAALEQQPDDPELLLRLAIAEVGAQHLDEAEEHLRRVRQLRVGNAEAQHYSGRVAFLKGDPDTAVRYFREAIRLAPERPEFHFWAARAALRLGAAHLPEALREAEQAIALDQNYASGYWMRGSVRLAQGRTTDALRDLHRALAQDPAPVEARAALGDAYEQLGRRREAALAYEQVIEEAPDEGFFHYRLGVLKMDLGDRGGGESALRQATLLGEVEEDPPSWVADAHRLYADALRLGGQREPAIRHYQRYLALAAPTSIDRPDVQRILVELGVAPPRDEFLPPP
ncbi:MAG: tetratricopeptide repeat protein [Sandaracinaceae bacterium]